MGNQNSTNKDKEDNKLKPKPISQILDYIATNYILTMDFDSLRKLYDSEYCNKLVILTSDIIERYFTDLEITYLAQRIKNGEEVNELEKDKVIFFDKDELEKLDVKNSIKKKRICIAISKFYVKIAHLFAAIVTTINPIYVYKDAEGNTVRATLYEKGKIPPNTPREIFKLNICENRINALKNGKSLEPNADGEISVAPEICSVNMSDNDELKDLDDEPGMPELMDLYYDDEYDFHTGRFLKMSKKTEEVYREDLQIFYNVFSGNAGPLPANITKFSDIKLRDYNKTEQCQGDNPKFGREVRGKLSDSMFAKYADNLKKMISQANTNQQMLLTIINQIFTYTVDPQTNKKRIRISPTLSEEKLQELVVEARALIIKLYLTCEIDYVEGIKLYEAIVDQKIYDTATRQIENVLKRKEDMITRVEPLPEPAEFKQLQQNAEEKLENDKAELDKKVDDIKKDQEQLRNNPNPESIVLDISGASTSSDVSNDQISNALNDEIPKPDNLANNEPPTMVN